LAGGFRLGMPGRPPSLESPKHHNQTIATKNNGCKEILRAARIIWAAIGADSGGISPENVANSGYRCPYSAKITQNAAQQTGNGSGRAFQPLFRLHSVDDQRLTDMVEPST
jgi:hypothetical protein